ncbi:MAG: YjgN family protein, partial [Nitrospira sp.]|nr:YjgN family protein [Nitrospira sp.]
QTGFEGDRFAYHGSGKELLIGWLKMMSCVGIPYSAMTYGVTWLGADPQTVLIFGLIAWLILFAFPPLASVWAMRYRFSRMSWRRVRFAFHAPVRSFLILVLKGTFLTLVTLGLYYPIYVSQKRAFLVSHTFFGSEPFNFNGQDKELFLACFKSILISIFLFFFGFVASFLWLAMGMWFMFPACMGILLMLIWAYLHAEIQRFFWNHTSLRSACCRSTVEFDTFYWLKLGNLALLMLSLGLAWPWVRTRNIRYEYKHHALEGPVELTGIVQNFKDASATGDEAAGFFDAGFDVG